MTRPIEWLLQRNGWRKLDDITLTDLATVGFRYGIRFHPRLMPIGRVWLRAARDQAT